MAFYEPPQHVRDNLHAQVEISHLPNETIIHLATAVSALIDPRDRTAAEDLTQHVLVTEPDQQQMELIKSIGEVSDMIGETMHRRVRTPILRVFNEERSGVGPHNMGLIVSRRQTVHTGIAGNGVIDLWAVPEDEDSLLELPLPVVAPNDPRISVYIRDEGQAELRPIAEILVTPGTVVVTHDAETSRDAAGNTWGLWTSLNRLETDSPFLALSGELLAVDPDRPIA